MPVARHSQYCDEGVKVVSYCPLCEASYNPESTKILGEKEDGHLMHIRCGNCSSAILALTLTSSVGVSSVGLVTDLDHHEVDRFKSAPAISTDDVIDIHHVLQNEKAMLGLLTA